MFGFAGLIVGSGETQGAVILTSGAGELMKPIHHRQPVILKPEREDDWLNPDTSEPEELDGIISNQVTPEALTKKLVSPKVNIIKNNRLLYYINVVIVIPV